MLNEKKRICYIISTLERCGPVNILFNILKYLNKDKFDVLIITLSKECINSRMDEFKSLGCNIIALNMSRMEGNIKGLKSIKKILNREKIDIVHSHGIRADIFSSKLKNIKTICTLHNYPYDDYVMTYGKVLGNIMAYKHTKILKNIDVKCACSKSVAKLFKENKNIIVDYVQNGVDLEVFPKMNINKKNEIRKKLNLPLDKNIFIVVGNITQRKDPLTIIKSFENCDENDLVLFLGDGDLYEDCLNISKRNKQVMFVGRVSNVSEYMLASDYYISASLAEGLPNTVLEAMSTGLPSILSNINPHLEISEFGKDIISIFENKNIDMLTNNIINIKKKDYELLSEESRKLIEYNLSADAMSKKYEEKYFNMI